jgi:hypothetical protein
MPYSYEQTQQHAGHSGFLAISVEADLYARGTGRAFILGG